VTGRASAEGGGAGSAGSPGVVTAAVLIIGNEVLSGRTRDQNLPYLAEALNAVGIRVVEARIIADDGTAIADAVNACRRRFDHVFTTGGIGPTHDDITAAAVALAFGRRLVRHAEAERLLRGHYRPDEINEARLKMADVPEGATLIANPVSTAPGFQVENVYVLPGVPRIMQAMVDGLCRRLSGGRPVLSEAIAAFTTEGVIAQPLARIQAAHPEVEIGSYPFVRAGRFGVSLVVRAPEAAAVAAALAAIRAMLADAGAEAIDLEQAG
jgi:molybdenum cofactor synthesis domain-containing protein